MVTNLADLRKLNPNHNGERWEAFWFMAQNTTNSKDSEINSPGTSESLSEERIKTKEFLKS